MPPYISKQAQFKRLCEVARDYAQTLERVLQQEGNVCGSILWLLVIHLEQMILREFQQLDQPRFLAY